MSPVTGSPTMIPTRNRRLPYHSVTERRSPVLCSGPYLPTALVISVQNNAPERRAGPWVSAHISALLRVLWRP